MSDVELNSESEWLLTDGQGGYALGTRALIASRRYHSLLVVAFPPPLGRTVLWPRVSEELVLADGEVVRLSGAWFAPAYFAGPDESVECLSFERLPHPSWTLRVAGRVLRRSLRLLPEVRGAALVWELIEGASATLRVRPLLAFRSHHHLQSIDEATAGDSMPNGGLRWRRSVSDPYLYVSSSGNLCDPTPYVHRDVSYPIEERRGYDHQDDQDAPAEWEISFNRERPAWMAVSLDELTEASVFEASGQGARPERAFRIVHADGRPGIIAGYPWFTEWARDTMIALPGLELGDGDGVRALKILSAWSARRRGGLMPTQLRDLGEGELATNTADASLQFIRALKLVMRHRQETCPSLELLNASCEILESYFHGTDHGIGVDQAGDGLLIANSEGEALTWMDAVLPSGPVTPRRGKVVELNALYLDALRTVAAWCDHGGRTADAQALRRRAVQVAESFSRFVIDAEHRLADVLEPCDPVSAKTANALRPGLLYALALDPCPLDRALCEQAFAAVMKHLWTSKGLRTLAPYHPDYEAHYGGTQGERDRAYHQGTVWPWLLGPLVDAALRLFGQDLSLVGNREVIQDLKDRLVPLMTELELNGSLYEVYDGSAPHSPGGCPAQAWSVAEVQRAHRDLSDALRGQ